MYILPKKLFLATVATLSLFVTANAQSFDSASAQAKQDLDSALEELKITRETIATDKIPLIRSVSTLERFVRNNRSSIVSDAYVIIVILVSTACATKSMRSKHRTNTPLACSTNLCAHSRLVSITASVSSTPQPQKKRNWHWKTPI